MQEVPCSRDARQRDIDTFGRLATKIAERDAVDEQQPEENAEQRPEARGTDRRTVKPRQDEQHENGGKHQQDTTKFIRHCTKDRVERQEIPFRNDVRRGLHRVCRDVIVRMAHCVREEEDSDSQQ